MRTLVIALLACLATRAPAAAADLEANKLMIRGYIEEVVNKHQPSAADRFVATDFIEHNPRLPQGLAGRKQYVTKVFAAFSDYHGEIQNLVAEGDMVAVRIRWTGTNDGLYDGRPATGNKLVFSTSDFYRIENGKIAERWDVVETLAYAVALGLVPPPNPASQSGAPKSP
ncbi:MAG TPA: ester cyclase [Bradyrhizobium sp.]|nr:ester cyclase [Bradyrhizobium sp.]